MANINVTLVVSFHDSQNRTIVLESISTNRCDWHPHGINTTQYRGADPCESIPHITDMHPGMPGEQHTLACIESMITTDTITELFACWVYGRRASGSQVSGNRKTNRTIVRSDEHR